ncbi:MAG: 2-alkenal reductase [Thermomicrobiales bacterium]|nr:2-alkenal reductase [Thermomicrobiales bacterium]
MAGQRMSRLRKAALTGALTPGLILGAAGFGVLPGGILPTGVTAQSVIDGGTCAAFGAPETAQASEMSVADVAEKANPAVVTILNLQPFSQADLSGISGIEGFPDLPQLPGIDELPGSEQGPDDDGDGTGQVDDSVDSDTLIPAGSGSGFIVDESGHVITNAHVVGGAEELTAVLSDGSEVPATVVGSDELLDVAILKLELPAGESVPGIATFGDSSSLRAGDQVVAIGNALGSFPNTVSEGTVNATDRSFPSEGGLTTWIQHDAEIWHGNSGGPLLNLRGEVVGVNTAGIGSGMMGADSGSADMAFAVEGNTVCSAAADLLANGKITWPYLGIQGEATAEGQSVVEVVEDGPSAAAGIEPGDVITVFDGQEISRTNSLLDLLFGREPGDVVTVTVERDGASQTFEVTLGERPEVTA